MRIGQGIDAHRFVDGGRLVIGGVEIPHPQGMEAHSDGDVLLHAITDAILGAAGEGDLGKHFPDTDPALRGIDSRILLRRARELAAGHGLGVGNVDATIIAQRPRMAAHIEPMRALIARDLGAAPAQINIKATTTERMGFTGRGEGIAAMAVVLLVEAKA